jgi:hypothetical protein
MIRKILLDTCNCKILCWWSVTVSRLLSGKSGKVSRCVDRVGWKVGVGKRGGGERIGRAGILRKENFAHT